MPYIDSKITLTLSDAQKNTLKTELGKIICTIPGKSEAFLMLGFQDNYDLYFKGEKLDLGAFIDVKVFGEAPEQALEKVSSQICDLYKKVLNIPPDAIYITYQPIFNWGWNGGNI